MPHLSAHRVGSRSHYERIVSARPAASAVPATLARRLPRRLRAGSDAELVAGVRAGDSAAFEAVFDRYHQPLLGFCRHMLGSQAEAEDALQHVFIAAHRTLTTDERPVRLKPWLYAVAGNRCTSVLRARREQVPLDDIGEPSTAGLALADEVEHREDLKHVLADVAGLPSEQRAALVLAELGDLSHEDIAAALDVRTDKVKALIFQARQSLIGSRRARDTDCAEIQEQLATLRGGALRRTPIARHLAACSACSAFKEDVRTQRAALGAVLPVAPVLALKGEILGAALAGGSGAAAGGAALGSASVATSAAAGSVATATKVLAALAVAGGAVGGGTALEHRLSSPPARVERAPVRAGPAAPALLGGARAGAGRGSAASIPTPATSSGRPISRDAGASRGRSASTPGPKPKAKARKPDRGSTSSKGRAANGGGKVKGSSATPRGPVRSRRPTAAGRAAERSPARAAQAGRSAATAPAEVPRLPALTDRVRPPIQPRSPAAATPTLPASGPKSGGRSTAEREAP